MNQGTSRSSRAQRTLKTSLFLVGIALVWNVALAFLASSGTAAADGLSTHQTRVPSQTVTELRNLGAQFSNTPYDTAEWHAVGMTLPTDAGDEQFSLVPSELFAPGSRDTSQLESGESHGATAYHFTGRTSREGDFLKLSLVRDQKTSSERFEGFARLNDVFYDVHSVEGTTLGLELSPIPAAEIEKLHDFCRSVRAPGSRYAQLQSATTSAAASFGANHRISAAGSLVLELVTEADFEMYQLHGSSVTQTNAFIATLINNVNGIYEADLGITLQIVFGHVQQSSADPYASGNTVNPESSLIEFQNYWNAQGPAFGDLVHMFTGRTLTPPTIGISYVGVVCDRTFGYGISMTNIAKRYRTIVAAHEIGHNLGADHDPLGSPYIMAPVANTATHFSPLSLSAITAYVTDFGSCLSQAGTNSNKPPLFEAISPQTVSEGSSVQFTVRAVDPEGAAVTLSFTPAVPGLTLTGNTATYSPGFDVNTGTADIVVSVTFKASDESGVSTSLPVAITVRNTNRAPSLTVPGPQTITEGQRLTFTLSGRDDDVQDTLTYTATGLPFGAFLNASTGSFRWTPRWYQSGTYPIRFFVTDNSGAQAQGTMTISVQNTLTGPPASTFNVPTVFRPTGGLWFRPSSAAIQLGLPGDVALSADYDGDDITDLIVWRPSTGTFYARLSDGSVESEPFGIPGDIPGLADFDRDGIADLWVYRGAGQFWVRLSSSQQVILVPFGLAGDIPVVCDYDGDGGADFGVFRPSSATWYIRQSNGSATATPFGRPNDIPVPGAYTAAGRCEIAVWEADRGDFNILGSGRQGFGLPGDVPSSTDFDRDGRLELTVWRPSEGNWYIRRNGAPLEVVQLGLESDEPAFSASLYHALRNTNRTNPGAIFAPDAASLYDRANRTLYLPSNAGTRTQSVIATPGTFLFRTDRNADGVPEVGTFTSGLWKFAFSSGGVETVPWGMNGDIPLDSDFDGDNKADVAVFRPTEGNWYVIDSLDSAVHVVPWGANGDRVVNKVDFNGDGVDDFTLFRGGAWYILDGRGNTASWVVPWGFGSDIPLSADLDADGKSDLAVYRGGLWFIRFSSSNTATVAFGLPTDIPTLVDFFGEGRASLALYRASTQQLLVRSLSGVTKVVQLPRKTTVVSGRSRKTVTVKLQAADRATPAPVN